uniref:Uncharacterized protein n=1 Tax=Rhizophora mucronata TaxID=61149 RepID=A0A2P2NVG8_RHIMU
MEVKQQSQGQPRFKPKAGSVFPKKRKLVKTMVLESLVQSIVSLCSSCFASSSESSNLPNKG